MFTDQLQDVLDAACHFCNYLNNANPHSPPSRFFLGGHSAGAHLAALLNLQWQNYAGGRAAPCGFIGIDGIYDLDRWSAYSRVLCFPCTCFI